jgi:hypothetical protein
MLSWQGLLLLLVYYEYMLLVLTATQMVKNQLLLQEMLWHNKVLWGSSVLGLPPSLI